MDDFVRSTRERLSIEGELGNGLRRSRNSLRVVCWTENTWRHHDQWIMIDDLGQIRVGARFS